MFSKYSSILFACLAIAFFSCNKDRLADDRVTIENYLAENNLTAEQTPEGVYYIIDEPGSGDSPTLSSSVTVHYEGFLLDGRKFDSSIDRGEASTFPLTGVIEGWQIGIPLFKKAGKGTLIIPSTLAYGSSSPGGIIGSNEILLFTINLIDFQ